MLALNWTPVIYNASVHLQGDILCSFSGKLTRVLPVHRRFLPRPPRLMGGDVMTATCDHNRAVAYRWGVQPSRGWRHVYRLWQLTNIELVVDSRWEALRICKYTRKHWKWELHIIFPLKLDSMNAKLYPDFLFSPASNIWNLPSHNLMCF